MSVGSSVRLLTISAYLTLLSISSAATSKPLAAGRIVAITSAADGGAIVTGWACEINNSVPTQVSIYVGDAYPVGQMIGTARANGELAVADCGAAGNRHGFAFKLDPQTVFRYGGLRVFVYADRPDLGGQPLAGPTTEAVLPAYTPIGTSPRNCDITDIASLKGCFALVSKFDQFSLRRDLTCTSVSECCGADNSALIKLNGVTHRVIDGNGHIIHRGPGALACGAIAIGHATDILVKDLMLDEGESIPPCELSVKDCPNTIAVDLSHNVRIDDSHIYFGKGYVVHVWGTDGFAFVRSSLSESGIIGLYIGHYKFAPSKNVVIAVSVFAHTRTNGIAIQGASGSDPANPVLIIGNVITWNHWHGLWPIAGVKDGITSGGQVLIADAANVRFTGNIISDGACGNCNPPGQPVTDVEIGDDTHPPAGVSNLTMDDNYLYNDAGTAFYQNRGTPVSAVTIEANRIAGKVQLDSVTGSVIRNNNSQEPQLPPARHQSALVLARAPRPGGPSIPIYRCLRGSTEVFTSTRACDGSGKLLSVPGYSYESTNPAARPFFACQIPKFGDDQVMSLDANCEGGRVIAQLGFAIPK